MKVYIIYYDWENTSGNHSGMAYFVNRYSEMSAHKVELIKVPDDYAARKPFRQRAWREILIAKLKVKAKKGDTIFFNEYLSQGHKTGHTVEIAHRLNKGRKIYNIAGLIHLPGKTLEGLYKRDYITGAVYSLDTAVVMGSGLEKFVRNYKHKRVERTFHYVDTDYYSPASKERTGEFTVICTGSLLRDYNILAEVIRLSKDIKFRVCLGKNTDDGLFKDMDNAEVYGFLKEDDLLGLMRTSDVHLSVLKDTEGSNAITTTMACGLPQIVNKTGSVEDYCDGGFTLFCDTAEEFSKALANLKQDSERLSIMKKAARVKALGFSLGLSVKWYDNFFSKISSS